MGRLPTKGPYMNALKILAKEYAGFKTANLMALPIVNYTAKVFEKELKNVASDVYRVWLNGGGK